MCFQLQLLKNENTSSKNDISASTGKLYTICEDDRGKIKQKLPVREFCKTLKNRKN